jgi:hypothetical protein
VCERRRKANVCEEEKCEEIDEGVWQFFVLLECDPDLFPTDSEVAFAFRKRWTWAGLLENDCLNMYISNFLGMLLM